MSKLSSKSSSFTERTGKARKNTSSKAARTLLAPSVPPPPTAPAGPGLRGRMSEETLADHDQVSEAPVPAPAPGEDTAADATPGAATAVSADQATEGTLEEVTAPAPTQATTAEPDIQDAEVSGVEGGNEETSTDTPTQGESGTLTRLVLHEPADDPQADVDQAPREAEAATVAMRLVRSPADDEEYDSADGVRRAPTGPAPVGHPELSPVELAEQQERTDHEAAPGEADAPAKNTKPRQRKPRLDVTGFTGVMDNGFPLARPGAAGMLQNSDEELHNTSMRVSKEMRRQLHELVLWETERVGAKVELERIIDCALLLLPSELPAVEKFLDQVPYEVRQPPQGPVNVGTRMRARHFDRIAMLPHRMGAEGLKPVKLAEVHRAVLHNYYTLYVAAYRTQA